MLHGLVQRDVAVLLGPVFAAASLVTVPPEHINIVHGGSVLPECAPFLRLALAPKLAVLARPVPPPCAYIIFRH